MCTPSALFAGISSVVDIATTSAKNRQEEKINEYKSQIAINNIENNKFLASQQVQQGIDSSHQAKIKSINNAAAQMAKNASNGFDMNSVTNIYNIDDIYNSAETEANNTKEEYLLKAQNYINSANNQILSLNAANEKSSTSGLTTGMNYLGSATKVASLWSERKNKYDL